jgi:gamma-D-glutamyl-L-lysine dipeptidyl-peptidase
MYGMVFQTIIQFNYSNGLLMTHEQEVFKKTTSPYSDTRVHVCELEADFSAQVISLSGRVLDRQTLNEVLSALGREFPEAKVASQAVTILRLEEPRLFTVATNLTSVHRSPSFGAELLDQMVYGRVVEVLEEKESWGFVRQMDGYLGWTYMPYLHEQPAAAATHLVLAPVIALHDGPESTADVVTHLMAGTGIRLDTIHQGWGQVVANQIGWLPLETLRTVQDIPQTKEARQATLSKDVIRMIGTPYLWGGISGMGIDCSGFSRLLHKWVGLDIPRDGDMQAGAGKLVEPPYQTGDLLFFGDKNTRKITHVTISLGGWKIIHSSRRRNGVYYDDVQEVASLRDSFICAATYINA